MSSTKGGNSLEAEWLTLKFSTRLVPGLAGVSNPTDAVSQFETPYNKEISPEQYPNSEKIADAITDRRLVFGEYFPAYGETP
jgi:hypothetical protein